MNKIKLGNFLADLRNEKGLTQEQLAEMINVNYKTISKWECGNSTPSLETLTELSEIFEVSLYELSNCERINNPFISKDNIKKVINKDNIKKFFIIKLIILILSIILLTFITYSCIYTINNYNQFQVYELVSEDEHLDIGGIFVKAKESYCLTVSHVKYLSHSESLANIETQSLEYSLIIGNEEEKTVVNFHESVKLEDALSRVKFYISNKKLNKSINDFYLKFRFNTTNNNTTTKTFKITLSNKQANNKLFY